MTTVGALDALKKQRPEWIPWLAVVEESLRETTHARWEGTVPDISETSGNGTPLLSGLTLNVDSAAVRRVFDRLIAAAAGSGSPRMATLERARRADVDVLALLRSSLQQQGDDAAALASASAADAEALQAVVALLALPVLQACNRRWSSSTPKSWTQGYCPVCGSWPAFAEVRGIERTRYLRCGRCGGEWQASILLCGYCGTVDHNDLVALVPEKAAAPGAIDACKRCQGYVKTFTRLQGCAPAAVMLEDLKTVDLDVAALEQGYTRPSGTGCSLEVIISDTGASRRFFAWNA